VLHCAMNKAMTRALYRCPMCRKFFRVGRTLNHKDRKVSKEEGVAAVLAGPVDESLECSVCHRRRRLHECRVKKACLNCGRPGVKLDHGRCSTCNLTGAGGRNKHVRSYNRKLRCL
jgi:hypothetical protein